MKRYLALGMLAIAPLVYAQELKLAVLDKLKEKASDVTNMNLNKDLIGMALGALGSAKSEDAAKVKKFVEGLNGILIRVLDFDQEGAYTKADIQSLVSELGGPGWNLAVSVEEDHGHEISRVWTKSDGSAEVGGMRILFAEPKELTVVAINGRIRVEDLKNLAGLGIPDINIGSEHTGTPPKKKEE